MIMGLGIGVVCMVFGMGLLIALSRSDAGAAVVERTTRRS